MPPHLSPVFWAVVIAAAVSATPSSGEETCVRQKHLEFLDSLLIGYDKRVWPMYEKGEATEVKVNVHVNSLGSVSAANMDYSMDIYLRQLWNDPRLNISAYCINETVTMNGQDIIGKIWTPDIFFRNVKSASFHYVTVPNKLIKLYPNGDILYSMRLTLTLACQMSFRRYPLDTQQCHLVFGSYAQTIDQVHFSWFDNNQVNFEDPLEISEFNLNKYEIGEFLRAIDTGAFSFLNVTFTLERQNGYHLIQTYLPTFLIVTISWVSFWLNVDATPARVTLGVTTLLTLTTVASGVRTQLPPVSYVKAIDVWIGYCSVMVFGALLEFTLVNYLSRSKIGPEFIKKSLKLCQQRESNKLSDADMAEMKATVKSRNGKRAMNVDKVSRVLFPVSFLIFNIVYWPYFLVPEESP